ncbi:MAG: sensor histidine kinase [Alkalispirochaeta sp.]
MALLHRPLLRRLWHAFGNLSLRHKYLLSHTTVVLLTVSVLTPASYMITRNQVESRTSEFATVILEKAAFIWEARITEVVDYFIAQFDATQLGRVLRQEPVDASPLSRLRINRVLSDIVTYKQEIRFALIETRDSRRFYHRKPGVTVTAEQVEALIPQDRVRALRARPFFAMGPEDTVVMSKVLYDLETTEYLGIMTVGLDYGTFSAVFPDEEDRALGNLIILDATTGEPAIHSPGAAKLLQSGRTGTVALTDYVVREIRTGDGRWILQSYTAIPDIVRLSQGAVPFILIATALALGLAIWLSAYLARRETVRISSIKDHAQQIAGGDLSVEPRDGHMDELGELAGALGDLAARIAELVERLASERARLSEAKYRAVQSEYSALQSRLNPHFIYNSLEMVNGMAKLGGNREISEMVQLIGELLRESVRRRDALIPLRDEIALIQKYLRIQEYLQEDRLETSVLVPDELGDLPVPTFILQPLVENAIVHGIEPQQESGRIEIEASRSGGTVELSVADNGVGMTEHRRVEAMEEAESEDPQHTKMGLASVDRRLRILFGEEYGARIESVVGGGTRVTLVFPEMSEEAGWPS